MDNLRYFLPETMDHNQETILGDVSDRLYSYGWNEKYIRAWWQTPMYELNNFCPLEALCANKFDLVHKCLDKTVRSYEKRVKQIEEERKQLSEILKS